MPQAGTTVMPGEISPQFWAMYGPLEGEFDEDWLKRIGPAHYYEAVDIFNKGSGVPVEPTQFWSFLYVEIHGPDKWVANPEFQRILDQEPMIDERKVFDPAAVAEETVVTPVTPGMPVDAVSPGIQELLDTTPSVSETGFVERVTTAATPGFAPPAPTRVITTAPAAPTGLEAIPKWVWGLGIAAVLWYIMK